MLAHVGFVQAHAVGPGAIQRVEDSRNAFTIFLQEGYRHRPRKPGPPPPRLALEAIINTIFEVIYQQARLASDAPMSELLAQMAFLTLAPFLGAREASRFIAGKLSE
jgi:hypothetical protein